MRARHVSLCLLAACAQAGIQPDGGGGPAPDARAGSIDARIPDAAIPIDAVPADATISAASFTDDTAGDFGGGSVTDAVVESWGAVEPVAYYTGGLLEHASDSGYFTDGPTATWAEVQGFAPTGKATYAWWTSANWVAGTPPGVGLTDGDYWSEWDEGEVYLEAGTWTFYLLVDDHGFVELAPPGSTSFQRVVSANWSTESSGTFVAASDGWYPIRFAIAEEAGNAEFHLQLAGPTLTEQPIPRQRLRARADDQAGLLETGYDDSHGVGDYNTTLDATGPGYTDWGIGNPGDLGITSADTFSVRWAGQMRIDTAGAYTFQYATDDGQRLWIDGTEYENSWAGATGDTTANNVTPSVDLAAGWHDLVIEQTENAGSAAALLSVASGPALTGAALPVSILRPAEGRADRVAPGSNHSDIAIPDVSTITSTAVVDAAAGATVTSVDVNYEFTHTYWGDLVITLIAPSGQSVILRNRADGATSGDKIERFTTSALNGATVAGTWTLQVQDAASADTGTLLDFAVTPHYAGGMAPIAPAASYESTVRDLGANVVGIDAIDWTERAPGGTDVAVSVRTCAAAADCASAAYSAPVTTPGGTPSVAPGEFLQYKVDFTSDGDHTPVLDAITFHWRRAQ